MQSFDQSFIDAGNYAKKIKQTIKELGKDNDTIIIFFTDHGTGIGERFGERNYGSFTFEETIRSFYLFIGKSIKKEERSNKLLETIDIFPTILELLKIKINYTLAGTSFAQFLQGKKELENKDYAFSETGALHGPYPSPKEPNVFCVKSLKYKLMYYKTTNEWRMYDLENDPKELNNIYGNDITLDKKFKEKLELWMKR